MSAANKPARRRRYLIDRSSQISAALHVTAVLLAIGLLDVLAVAVISGPDVEGGSTLAASRSLLFGVHAVCFLLGALFLFWTVVQLTHRFVGPAHVMQAALAGMRKGEYGRRLTLRRSDYLLALAEEIDALREEIATRDVDQARTLHRLERGLEQHDDPVVLDSLRTLGSALPALPPRQYNPAYEGLERRSA